MLLIDIYWLMVYFHTFNWLNEAFNLEQKFVTYSPIKFNGKQMYALLPLTDVCHQE